MKAEQLILEFSGRQFEKLDLRAHIKARGGIVRLLGGQPCLRQNVLHVFPCLAQASTCEASNSPRRARYRTEAFRPDKAHWIGSMRSGRKTNHCSPDESLPVLFGKVMAYGLYNVWGGPLPVLIWIKATRAWNLRSGVD